MAARAPRLPSALAAFVLHRYDWSESSLILDLFTREQGRLAAVAKGAKRPYSQLRAVLLPFQRLTIGLGRTPSPDGAADVQNLRNVERAEGPAMLRGAALFSGFYLNELLMKLVARHDPHPALFDAYAATLEHLGDEEPVRAQIALRAFELTLLQQIGVLPDLSVATLTREPVDPAVRYTFDPEAGVGTGGSRALEVSGQTLIGLQAALEHGSVPALQQACAAAPGELKALLRVQLHYHLGSSTLRTRQVMLEAQALDHRGATPADPEAR